MYFGIIKKREVCEQIAIDGISFTDTKTNYSGRINILVQSSRGNDWFQVRNSSYLFHRSWIELLVDDDEYGILNWTNHAGNSSYELYDRTRYDEDSVFVTYDGHVISSVNVERRDNEIDTENISSFPMDRRVIICPHCGISVKRFHLLRDNGNYYCEHCFYEKGDRCSICGNETECKDVEGQKVCPDCEHKIVTCSICGKVTLQGTTVDDIEYCNKCITKMKVLKKIVTCESCGTAYHADSDNYSKKSRLCSICRFKMRVNGRIQQYSYKPTPLFKVGDQDDTLFYGVELEVITPGFRDDISRMLQYKVNDDDEFVYCKFDRSIGNEGMAGFEIVTHPFNMSWLKSDEGTRKLNDILNVKKFGCKSFQTNTCGMHVHMSKNSFENDHLYKFLYMIFNHKEFCITISDRTNISKVDRYCSFEPDHSIERLARERINETGDARHKAVNLSNANTVEIRIFRGTLDIKRFMKNLEFCQSMFDFTKVCNNNQLNVSEYKKFIVTNSSTYPNLYSFLVEKKEIV